ncbi:MAG: zinc ribbon domain-containing protein [Myxococcota bacterium]
MPLYRYYCPANDTTVEVSHGMREAIERWGDLCAAAGLEVGPTDASSPVERHLFPPAVHTPMSNTQLKSKGFTKLVRRDKGVYENVTALQGEKRYVKADDPSSMPDFKGRNLD